MKKKNESIKDVVKMLIGDINPVGDTYHDNVVAENIDLLGELMIYYTNELVINACDESQEGSIQNVRDMSKNILQYIKDRTGDVLDD